MAKRQKQRLEEQRQALEALGKPKGMGLADARRQLRAAAKAAAVILVLTWVLAAGFASGLDTFIPVYVALALSLAMAIAALLIRRNMKKSEDMGALITGGDEMSSEEREARLAKLDAKAEKGDSGALLAKAQLKMNEEPREALAILEKIDLTKGVKLVHLQVRAMRAMLHLNLGEVKAARVLAEQIDLKKAPDPKSRANFSAVVAEAWARTGNPIEATELLDKYDDTDEEFGDIRMQLLRARVFACAHRQDLKAMRKALKTLMDISPQLAGMFVGQKRIHPLLEKEARKMLEKSGLGPKQRIQSVRR